MTTRPPDMDADDLHRAIIHRSAYRDISAERVQRWIDHLGRAEFDRLYGLQLRWTGIPDKKEREQARKDLRAAIEEAAR